jgi:hypothetical protein
MPLSGRKCGDDRRALRGELVEGERRESVCPSSFPRKHVTPAKARHPRESTSPPRKHVTPAKAGAGNRLSVVIPAKAGIHLLPISLALSSHPKLDNMDSRFRGNDESRGAFAGMTNPEELSRE